jgi:hypothetical protein
MLRFRVLEDLLLQVLFCFAARTLLEVGDGLCPNANVIRLPLPKFSKFPNMTTETLENDRALRGRSFINVIPRSGATWGSHPQLFREVREFSEFSDSLSLNSINSLNSLNSPNSPYTKNPPRVRKREEKE